MWLQALCSHPACLAHAPIDRHLAHRLAPPRRNLPHDLQQRLQARQHLPAAAVQPRGAQQAAGWGRSEYHSRQLPCLPSVAQPGTPTRPSGGQRQHKHPCLLQLPQHEDSSGSSSTGSTGSSSSSSRKSRPADSHALEQETPRPPGQAGGVVHAVLAGEHAWGGRRGGREQARSACLHVVEWGQRANGRPAVRMRTCGAANQIG